MRRRRRHSGRSNGTLVAMCVTLLAACSGQGSTNGAAAVTQPRWGPDEAWTVARNPRVSIGVVTGDDAFQFDDVSAGARLPDGRLVVVDQRAARVRLYDAEGRHLGDLGVPGDGPGEFRRPSRVVAYPDGAIDVWDAMAWRRTRFEADGTLADVRTTGLRELATLIRPPRYPAAAHLLPDGGLIIETVDKGADAGKAGYLGEPGEAIREARAVALVDAALTERAERGTLLGEEQIVVEAPWGPQPIGAPLAPRIHIASQPGGTTHCVGDQSTSKVTCFDGGGASWEVTWSAPSRPFDRDGRQIAEWRVETHRLYAGKLAPNQVDDLLDQIPLPESWPPWSALHLDRAGHVWIELGPTGDALEYWVFDRDGVFLGPVIVPEMRILEIGENYLLGVRTDDVDVQHVQLHDLTKPQPS